MRKLLSKSLFLAVLTAMLLTVTAFASEPNDGIVTADALRLRSEPSTDASTITYLSSGDVVEVLNKKGDWYLVTYDGYTGYVYAAYLSTRTSEAAADGFLEESMAGKTGVITGDEVNFREGPSTDDAVLSRLYSGDEVTIVSITGGWCRVDQDGTVGYVNADYISVDGLPLVNPKGVVTGDCVNVRSTPSMDGGILTKVYGGSMVDLLSVDGDWYAVSVDGTRGYIRSDYIRIYTPGTASGVGAEAAAAAYEYLGVRYRYGGASPSGFDCSGFTMYIYGLFGYSLPHSATSQWNNTGTYVERSDLQPGDLVLFCDPSRSNGKACSHVGIYVGDGNFIHASSSSTGYVKVSSLSETYYNNYYVGAKRVA